MDPWHVIVRFQCSWDSSTPSMPLSAAVTAQSFVTLPDGSPVIFNVTVRTGARASESLSERRRAVRKALGGKFDGFRFAVLLLVCGSPGKRLLIVGRWTMWLEGDAMHAEAGVHGVWHEADGWRRGDPRPAVAAIEEDPPFHRADALADTGAAILATATKAAADRSRTSVTAVREICYELSEVISEGLRPDARKSPAPTIPQVMSLRAALALARDEARETIRRQFELGPDDREAYERYRRAADPALMIDFEPADHTTRTWMRTHDAGIRQCRAIEDQLAEQIEMLSGTLDAASTMWTAQQAKSSEDLNKVASAAALGLGVPSLVLAYYGADHLVDLHISAGSTVVAWLPLIVGAVPAAILLRNHQPHWWTSGRSSWLTALIGGTLAAIVAIGSIASWALR